MDSRRFHQPANASPDGSPAGLLNTLHIPDMKPLLIALSTAVNFRVPADRITAGGVA